jgi:hypothetical protein
MRRKALDCKKVKIIGADRKERSHACAHDACQPCQASHATLALTASAAPLCNARERARETMNDQEGLVAARYQAQLQRLRAAQAETAVRQPLGGEYPKRQCLPSGQHLPRAAVSRPGLLAAQRPPACAISTATAGTSRVHQQSASAHARAPLARGNMAGGGTAAVAARKRAVQQEASQRTLPQGEALPEG